MKILMVNKYLYPRAGAETYMITLAKELADKGHKLAFFGMDHPLNISFAPIYSVPFIEFGMTESFLAQSFNIAKAMFDSFIQTTKKRFNECVKDFKPDIIHAHNIYNQLPPDLFAGAARSAPVVMTMHDYKAVCPSYNLFTDGMPCKRCLAGSFLPCVRHRCVQGNQLKSFAAAASATVHRLKKTYQIGYDRFIAPSAFMKKVLVEGGFNENVVSVIHNFVRAKEFIPISRPELFFAGRLCAEKGVCQLLEAYAHIPDPRPILKIAGEGPMKEDLMAQALKLNLKNVKWLGKLTQDQVHAELVKSAMLLVPSIWYENCPMSILESFANGRPVIASNLGGNAELINDGVEGVLVNPHDPCEFSQKIQRALSDPLKLQEMSQASYSRSITYYSPATHLTKILEIYDYLMNTSSKDSYDSCHR